MQVFEITDGRLPTNFLTDATPSQKFRAQAQWARYALAQELKALEYKPELNETVVRCVAEIATLRVAEAFLPVLRTLYVIDKLVQEIHTIAKGIDYAGGKNLVRNR